MSYFEEQDPFTGERSSFGGIAEAAAEYHARGEQCPWDCSRCIGEWWDDEPEPLTDEELATLAEQAAARAAEVAAEAAAYNASWGNIEPPF